MEALFGSNNHGGDKAADLASLIIAQAALEVPRLLGLLAMILHNEIFTSGGDQNLITRILSKSKNETDPENKDDGESDDDNDDEGDDEDAENQEEDDGGDDGSDDNGNEEEDDDDDDEAHIGFVSSIMSKIMGQISDEVWNVIQSNETNIQGAVNAIYNRILNPEKVPEPSSKKLNQEGKEEQDLPTIVAVEGEDGDLEEPPGFGFSSTQCNDIGATKPPMNSENGNEAKPNGGELAAISNPGDEEEDPEVPPRFG